MLLQDIVNDWEWGEWIWYILHSKWSWISPALLCLPIKQQQQLVGLYPRYFFMHLFDDAHNIILEVNDQYFAMICILYSCYDTRNRKPAASVIQCYFHPMACHHDIVYIGHNLLYMHFIGIGSVYWDPPGISGRNDDVYLCIIWIKCHPQGWLSQLYHLVWAIGHVSLLASLYNPIVNPAMVSTVGFYDRNELYGSPDVRNCRMPNSLAWAFFCYQPD